MRILTVLPLLSVALAAAAPQKAISPHAVVADIQQSALMDNLARLARIAENNGGNRAFGLPGYRASVDFVLERLAKFGRTVDFHEQAFQALFAIVDDIQLSAVGGEDVYVFGLTYSPSTVPGGVTAELVLAPDGLEGCSAAGFDGRDVKDKIVLTQRFRCPDGTTLGGRVRAAVAAGAVAVIVYHDLPTKPTAGTLSAPDPVGYRSAGFINKADGEAWRARIEAGETIQVNFRHLQTIENRTTWNVIAETKGGDPSSVIVLGAHLDSVQAGPGVNDDGSGTSLIMELLASTQQYRPNLKLRFCWWGAEENGLLGSKHYVAALPARDLQNIRAYLNFDMVSRGYFGVFDGDGSTHGLAGAAGSGVIEALLAEYLEKKEHVTVTPAVFTGGSDYASFMSQGIPVGGLHTGTGVEQDACYHQECDGYGNANATVLAKNARTAGHVMARLAIDGKKLIPKWNSTAAVADRRSGMSAMLVNDQGFAWGVEEGGRHTGCELGDE